MPYETNNVQVANCLEAMRQIPAGSIALAFADPPFNIGYAYDSYDDRLNSDAYLCWSKDWMAEVVRTLKPDGTFWLAIGDEYAAELKLIATAALGLTCRSWVVWYYTFGVNCTRKFSRSHCHLLYFVKDPELFTFNEEAIRVPSARQLVYADKRANARGRLPDDTWILRPQDLPDGFRTDQDTWYVPRVCGTFKERAGWHGCQMPELVLGRIIRACSYPRDIVLDPFAGSGTTLAVAKKLHRRWIGFELSKQYANQIAARLERTRPGAPLDGFEDPLTSAPRTPPPGRRRSSATGGRISDGKQSTSPAIQKLNLSLGQVAVANGELLTATTEAYLAACDGYSIDRVIADPPLNQAFVQACADLGITDEARVLNHRLLSLRKSGKLRALPRPRRTNLPPSDVDRYVFASEIAWCILGTERQMSLDDILCDPDVASEFDRIAARFAPGWMPWHYRWGAMTLRKRAGINRRHADNLSDDLKNRKFRSPVSVDDLDRAPAAEGIYSIEGASTLYLGKTSHLHDRITRQMERLEELLPALNCHEIRPAQVRVRTMPLPDVAESERWGLYLWWMDKQRPKANILQQVRRPCGHGHCVT